MERNNANTRPQGIQNVELVALVLAIGLIVTWLFYGWLNIPREIVPWLLYSAAGIVLLTAMLQIVTLKGWSGLARLEYFLKAFAVVLLLVGIQLSQDTTGAVYEAGNILRVFGLGVIVIGFFEKHWLTKGVLRLKQIRNS